MQERALALLQREEEESSYGDSDSMSLLALEDRHCFKLLEHPSFTLEAFNWLMKRELRTAHEIERSKGVTLISHVRITTKNSFFRSLPSLRKRLTHAVLFRRRLLLVLDNPIICLSVVLLEGACIHVQPDHSLLIQTPNEEWGLLFKTASERETWTECLFEAAECPFEAADSSEDARPVRTLDTPSATAPLHSEEDERGPPEPPPMCVFKPKQRVEVEEDFPAVHPLHLQLSRGDIVEVINVDFFPWLIGRCEDGTQGYFPKDAVRLEQAAVKPRRLESSSIDIAGSLHHSVFETCPVEIIWSVILLLQPSDICSVRLACKGLYCIAEDDSVWTHIGACIYPEQSRSPMFASFIAMSQSALGGGLQHSGVVKRFAQRRALAKNSGETPTVPSQLVLPGVWRHPTIASSSYSDWSDWSDEWD